MKIRKGEALLVEHQKGNFKGIGKDNFDTDKGDTYPVTIICGVTNQIWKEGEEIQCDEECKITSHPFLPFLAIDASDHLDKLKYPKQVSTKFDGCRGTFHDTLGLVTRGLKQVPNKQLQDKFYELREYAKNNDVIFDGEFYDHDLTFQEITALFMTKDFLDPKNIKKLEKENSRLLQFYNEDKTMFTNPLKYHCFEMHSIQERHIVFKETISRLVNLHSSGGVFVDMVIVPQHIVNNKDEVKNLFSVVLDDGFEGLIMRDPDSTYKYGRSTLNEESMLKVKPFETFDAKITGVVQATEVDPNAEKKINELGRSVTSKKKDDRIPIEKASGFWVNYNGVEQKVSLAMTDPEKEEVWKNRESYIGRMIEFRGMLVGSKDRIRHPVMVRFREDRD